MILFGSIGAYRKDDQAWTLAATRTPGSRSELTPQLQQGEIADGLWQQQTDTTVLFQLTDGPQTQNALASTSLWETCPEEVSLMEDLPPPVLRDFLYIDIARVRSFLAQMAEGVPEQLVTAMSDGRHRRGGLALLPVSFEIGGANEQRVEETRSLNDTLFVLFEEAAESLGWLKDITDIASDVQSWMSGDLHRSLPPSSIIRVTGSTRLVDATHLRATLERVVSLMQNIMASAPTTVAPARPSGGQRNQPRGRGPQRDQLPGGISSAQVKAIGAVFESLMPTGVSVKVMPCGSGHPSYALSGTLLERADYLEPERTVLFSRYGVTPSDWTIVAVVTRSQELGVPPDLNELPSMTAQGGALDREAIERFAETMLSYLEQVGMTEAPRAPEIGITPLAVYRVVPHTSLTC